MNDLAHPSARAHPVVAVVALVHRRTLLDLLHWRPLSPWSVAFYDTAGKQRMRDTFHSKRRALTAAADWNDDASGLRFGLCNADGCDDQCADLVPWTVR